MKGLLLSAALILTAACASTSTVYPPPQTSSSPEVARDETASRGAFPNLDHERVDYWVERFTKGDKRAEFETYLSRKPRYEEMLTSALRKRGMPEELLYLVMIESGFNPEAHSQASARGIWQLLPGTARQYGLRVDEDVDERLDAEKSTDAALSYLSYLYNRFGSWYLAAAAYNAGERRVGTIMKEATGAERGTDEDYYRIWQQLPGETRDFVPVMIAAMRIGEDPKKHGFM